MRHLQLLPGGRPARPTEPTVLGVRREALSLHLLYEPFV